MSALVFTVLGVDRPGLVERISSAVTGCGGNWLGSHLSSMEGCFGGLVHVAVPRHELARLVAALRELSDEGLEVSVRETVEEPAGEPYQEVELEVIGNDRPGIVSRISHAVAARGINMLELRTEWSSAPMAGHSIFQARATLLVPPDASVSALKQDLEEIAGDLMVDLRLE